uniref:BZIP domain-containing protein n=2 Tax=Populus trichocarpa TaxID=3694 RepID=A0A2K1R4V0_POPTR
MFYEFEGCRAISLDFARHDQTNFSSVSLNKPTPSRQIFEKLASCLLLQRKPAMDYESPWQNLFEASLALPAHEFEVYEEFETDQKARVNQQACNYFLAAGPASPHQSSNITDTDKKGQGLEATKDQVAKKRKIDKAYRERCKAGANDTDLQRENTQLKNKIALLRSQVNDQNNLDKLQLQEKNAQLEHDKSSLEVIVQALCEKINNEKGHEGDHAS